MLSNEIFKIHERRSRGKDFAWNSAFYTLFHIILRFAIGKSNFIIDLKFTRVEQFLGKTSHYPEFVQFLLFKSNWLVTYQKLVSQIWTIVSLPVIVLKLDNKKCQVNTRQFLFSKNSENTESSFLTQSCTKTRQKKMSSKYWPVTV